MAKGKKTGGRQKGTPNKLPRDLKVALLDAAEAAGAAHGPEGMKSYLTWAAKECPAPFLGLLGKVLPLQVAGTDENGNPTRFVIDVVYPASK